MSTLEKLIAARSPASQARIMTLAEEMEAEYLLARIRQDLGRSQRDVAQSLGISQPAVCKMEKGSRNIGLMTLKKYIEALGGRLSLQIDLPQGGARVYGV